VTDLAAQAIAIGLVGYAGVGLLFALPFAARGVDRLDPDARGARLGFRLAILPASVALWPLLLRRWRAGDAQPEERNAHRDAPRREAGR